MMGEYKSGLASVGSVAGVVFPAVVLGVVFLTAACSAMPRGPQEPEALDDAAIVERYEAYLERHPFQAESDPIYFRLALLHLETGSSVYDLGKARTRLWQLAARPQGPYSEGAERILRLLAELDQLRGETSLKARSLEQAAADAAEWSEAARLAESQASAKRASADQLAQELAALRGRLGRLSRENSAQREQIERLSQELEALKRIDVQQMH